MRHNASQCQTQRQIFPLIEDGNLSEQPEPPLTMYRVLAGANQIGERRRQRQHPVYSKPELLATQSNQVWSWDISKLKGPIKWSYFHLHAERAIMPSGVCFHPTPR